MLDRYPLKNFTKEKYYEIYGAKGSDEGYDKLHWMAKKPAVKLTAKPAAKPAVKKAEPRKTTVAKKPATAAKPKSAFSWLNKLKKAK